MTDHVPGATTAALLRRRARAGDLWLPTHGSSMGHTIVGGARVRVRATARAPRIGEVWAFVTASGDVTVHRCLRRTGGARFVFVGDASQWADRPVDRTLLVGRVVATDADAGAWRLRRVGAIAPLLRAVGRRVRRTLALR